MRITTTRTPREFRPDGLVQCYRPSISASVFLDGADHMLWTEDPAELRDLAAVLLLTADQLERAIDDPDVAGTFRIPAPQPVEVAS